MDRWIDGWACSHHPTGHKEHYNSQPGSQADRRTDISQWSGGVEGKQDIGRQAVSQAVRETAWKIPG